MLVLQVLMSTASGINADTPTLKKCSASLAQKHMFSCMSVSTAELCLAANLPDAIPDYLRVRCEV